ncbi:hypothetical protein KIH87_01375 [Paraneptunicella aestuarii]|uniref:hypothetical protein n=1 Tax=Paraneptunicella aestuarii TaxID=2831148 RepID=UPI001E5295EA|nr:hypothetical protein [Paraneptunicella aestuarii]UAA39048.1 hypothetical protein KIH87_01375 [Paraneptunicella aestuarii]
MHIITVNNFIRATGVKKEKLKMLLGNNKTITETEAIALTQKLGLSPSYVMQLFIKD